MRRGKAAEWAAKNPILGDGEPGYETDSRKLKIGDGLSYWNNLPYVVGGEIDGSLIADGTLTLAKTDQLTQAPPGGDNGIMVCNDGHEYELASTTAVADYKVPQVQTDKTIDYDWPIANGTPSSASDTGEAGKMLWDADYLYVCVATNTWKRVAIATWP